ncbi:MAG: aldehyde dehydrogenase family protein, partial [Rhodobacteraceae bacterium]|nr:aldehyde dehydrogenase family protein [Paracoccaceae bacterium]
MQTQIDRLWFDPAEMLIGGIWRPGSATLPVEDPSTGAGIGSIARGTSADIDAAVAAAQSARQGEWGRLTAA